MTTGLITWIIQDGLDGAPTVDFYFVIHMDGLLIILLDR